MNDILMRSLLFDFYGELLTEHQKTIYEEYISDDLSLSEIAQVHEISRQGVHDLIKRCDKILSEYEEKLHLVERFINAKKKIERICEIADSKDAESRESINDIRKIAYEILEEL